MNTVLRARKSAVILMTSAALVLAGCGSSSDSDKVSVDGEEQDQAPVEFQAETDFAGLTSLDSGIEFTATEASESNALLAPGLDLQITEVAQSPHIPADVFEEVSGDSPGLNDDEEPITEVHAADGHVFYLAKFNSSDPGWEVGGDDPDTSVTLHSANDEIDSVFSTRDGTAQQGTIVISLPEESSPDAASLRSETADKKQSLSIITGERLSSDIDYIYEATDKSVELVSADSINESFPAWAGGDDYVEGEVVGAEFANFLQPKGGGQGWAGAGKHYVVVDLEWRKVSSTSFDESTIYVELENGDTIYPARNVNSLSSNPIAFEIPIETEEFQVVLETDIKVGGGANAPRHQWDPLVAEFTVKEGSTS